MKEAFTFTFKFILAVTVGTLISATPAILAYLLVCPWFLLLMLPALLLGGTVAVCLSDKIL